MIHTGERYINPLTDFGFKRIFGTPFNRDLLISFLNAVLDGERNIVELKYNNSEKFGTNESQRKAVFDVYCTTDDGSRFIVEMQNVYQDFYKDRSIFYSTFPITDQAKKGVWNYELQPVYTVGVLNFAFPEDKRSDDSGIFREVKLMDINRKEVFYDKLTYIYIELANFNKELEDCKSMIDKWLFCLKNMSNLLERPTELQGRVFEKLFKTAEIAKFKPMELKAYEQSIGAYRDIVNGMDAAKREGIAIGEAKGRAEGLTAGKLEMAKEMARKLKAAGVSDDIILLSSGLTMEQLKKL
ncbi:MAG: Rpn family recombination-promoting nuclease/putative transposase [Prevotella sp.]|uniref:Rpn family recombination-promoting nuclease/putative transposase n=1 Tax=Prevotella sp. AGR2160 TaxID=1280674 RepID=UPI000401B6A2|nr:Rpn family recombination-promoting nuclease/putative transposase [Prevotella sp. AGR2160]MDD5862348.1 Rpn family recombination-promoting nuclease/putative transposase [Prevotella sp.]